ncbi:LacI family DNA-binding transcriptional regulator [Microbulbifer pacificus]|uniref:LacI family DNA-binding transcriptional regulator n=1 Tax=Microbulbifer pacificus TaxID=407164 RepID=UPI000CF51DBE|nr:LacI family DNA-binding transcriptional regulator [Microbulbifer pacificus]
MTGIIEIAKAANVSPSTVSRVIHNPELVSEEKRNQVLEVINRTGYTPSNLGAGLRKAKTNNLVAIIPDVTSAFNYPVIRAIESIALENGYSLLLGDTQELESRERSFAAMARSRQADGILLFCSNLPIDVDPDIPLADQLPPMVNACEPIDLPGLPKVNIDNVAAAEEAVNYLITLGHKRIAAITGHLKSPSTQDRLKGYRYALRGAGIQVDDSLIEAGNYGLKDAEQATRKLMAQPNRPTAIFNFSDEMAMSCLATLHDMGLRIPQDVSVMGFDDISYAEYCYPALTTVAQPMTEIGIECMELLLPQLNGKKMQACNKILPHRLMIRKSTGPAPAG